MLVNISHVAVYVGRNTRKSRRMKRLEPKAPPLTRDRVASVSAAPGLLLPILVLSLVCCALSGPASAAEPQPDAAPQAPAVAPDPAPDTTNEAPPQQSAPAPAPPVQVAPQVPAMGEPPAAPAATPPTAAPQGTSPEPKARSKPARVRRETPEPRPERTAGPADPSLLLPVDSFLAGVQGDENSPSHLVLLAAAALVALLMASGSLVSVATRVWPGQLG